MKKQISREHHLICNGKTNRPREKGLLFFDTQMKTNLAAWNELLKSEQNLNAKVFGKQTVFLDTCIGDSSSSLVNVLYAS